MLSESQCQVRNVQFLCLFKNQIKRQLLTVMLPYDSNSSVAVTPCIHIRIVETSWPLTPAAADPCNPTELDLVSSGQVCTVQWRWGVGIKSPTESELWMVILRKSPDQSCRRWPPEKFKRAQTCESAAHQSRTVFAGFHLRRHSICIQFPVPNCSQNKALI